MTAPAAERQRERQRRAAPAGPADALLVVEPHRRHVGHHHGQQRADVDARLHRRGDAQQIDVVGERLLGADRDVLEEPLPIAREQLVRLACQLGAVQPEDGAGISRQPAVVVDGPALHRQRRCAAAHRAAA